MRAPAKFAAYREAVPAVVEAFGGRYLVRGGTVEVLEAGRVAVEPGGVGHLLEAEAETMRAMREGRWDRAFVDALEARCNN